MHTDGNEKIFPILVSALFVFKYIKKRSWINPRPLGKQQSAYFLYTKTRMIPSTPSSWATISLSTSPTTSNRV